MANPHSLLLRSSNSAPLLLLERGRYKHMDVRIVHGALKGNFGTIIDTHWSKSNISDSWAGGDSAEYEEIAVVQTETQAVKSSCSYRLDELRERQ
jgi:hypothetical protein